MDVTSIFKPQGDAVRVLVLHSTKDGLGQNTVSLLRSNLMAGIGSTEHRLASLSDVATLARPSQPYHVVLLVAHGDKASNQAWLFGDTNTDGADIGTSAGVLKAALDGLLNDCLCLFGVCHFGQDLLQLAIVDQGGALACVAPKAGCTITNLDIANEFAKLLNEMQVRKHLPVGVDDLNEIMHKALPGELRKRLAVYTAAT